MNRNTLILSALIASSGAWTCAPALASETIRANQPSVEIVADDGSVFARYDLATLSQRGKLRAYVQAEHGRNYGVRVRNNSGARIGLVIAVDGRNIISGQKSNLRSNEPMYVLGAYQQATYEGWRTSDTRVQRFFFTEAEDSYADAWGDRSAMGVIAVAAFREMPRAQPRRPLALQERAPSASAPGESRLRKSMESADSASAPGTGFGDGHDSHSVRVYFTPREQPFTTHYLKYEWRQTLVDLGIIHEALPRNRFWLDQPGQMQGFAPYPPGHWNQRR
jgi:hypothetical protein